MAASTSNICSTKFFVAVLLISAIPIAIIISLETASLSTHAYYYNSGGWMRECAKWDEVNRRFIVSFFDGGIGEIRVDDDGKEGALEEVTVVKEADLAGNSSLGMVIDRPRNRLLVAIADVFGNKYSAIAAYDLTSWNRLFLTHLTGEKTFADDVAVDHEGYAYVTDTKGSKIWKVAPDGKFLHLIESPLFKPKEWYKNLVGLNGIVYHPDGYLIVIHTFSGKLFKIETGNNKDGGEEVKPIDIIKGSLLLGDGLELLSPTKLVVAGSKTSLLVESSDGWETAQVVGKFKGPIHRLMTAATVKDDKVYVNHMIGMGYPKRKHAIVEAVFES
ncbi:uncharacterized protein LOC124914536 [Impatiens glandulifera]|uniref:uncharacterized protein LOC124914536 n=1 Tax=Impatiens glandulifera TaxID=253017 RepID=UPI001FB13A45|nr:uncharacterized protein LOC124914536 [Impatiens glandulifera]